MNILSEYTFGDMHLIFTIGGWDGKTVGLVLVPEKLKGDVSQEKEYSINPLVELKSVHDPYGIHYIQGRSLRNSFTALKMLYESQEVVDFCGGKTIVTTFRNERNLVAKSEITYYDGYEALEFKSTVINEGEIDEKIEVLSSFCLDGLTPFDKDESPENIYLHRLRSRWSTEGRHCVDLLEDLQLEPSWNRFSAACERYGHAGSMPLNGFVPFVGIEDRAKGVMWGAQIATPGSWQVDVFRRDDAVSISGGLADRDFGHWTKTLKPAQCFTTPRAFVTVCEGDIDELSNRLVGVHQRTYEDVNGFESDLPVLFNEYCLTWGNPTAEAIEETARSLKGKGMKYYVIDAGWYGSRTAPWAAAQGDWIPNEEMYPEGLKKSIDIIKENGMLPGIWFEFESCASLSQAYKMDVHKLTRDGKIIVVGGRHFWDFRDPWVEKYLTERVIEFLKYNGFKYIKVDYNDDIGFGVDGDESDGENLRQHLESVQAFFRKIHKEIPDLVIENCSSGGHRLEPSMMELVSMASFSDAHEITSIPIVAANVQRLILPRKSQIWAVIKAADSDKRIVYSMAAAFLGRMCLSGEVMSLTDAQWALVDKGVSYYNEVSHIIRDGRSYRYGPKVVNYNHPKGWQAVVRKTEKEALVTFHTFEGELPDTVEIPVGDYEIASYYSDLQQELAVENGSLIVKPSDNYQGLVVRLISK